MSLSYLEQLKSDSAIFLLKLLHTTTTHSTFARMPLIPAKELGAVYDPVTGYLTLSACGDVNIQFRGFHFKRDPLWVGGLRFFLEAYSHVGPRHFVEKSYSIDQPFHIPNLNRIVLTGEIIIITYNHPKGLLVPVYWLGLDDSKPTVPGSTPTSELKLAPAADGAVQALVADPVKLYTPVGGTVSIRANLNQITVVGSIDVDFDPQSLAMQNADFKQGALYWTFKALERGTLVVTVNQYPFPPTPRKPDEAPWSWIYIVYAGLPVTSSSSPGTAGALSGPPATPLKTGLTLSFLGFVFETFRIINKSRPGLEPELIYVDATNPLPTAKGELSVLVCMFKTKEGSATIHSKAWGEWDEPCFTREPPPRDLEPFAIEDLKDIEAAKEALRKAGILQGVEEARLSRVRLEIQPIEIQPYYTFTLVDGAIVQVGAIDLSTREPERESEPAKGKLNGA